jgi:hypothetical protein
MAEEQRHDVPVRGADLLAGEDEEAGRELACGEPSIVSWSVTATPESPRAAAVSRISSGSATESWE